MTINCQNCGSPFRTYPAFNSKYCSKPCYYASKIGKPRPGVRHSKIVVCQMCGQPSEKKTAWEAKRSKYCSKCRFRAAALTRGDKGRKLTLNCVRCGSQFISYASKNLYYCSWECYTESKPHPPIGANQLGYKPYGIEFRNELKKRIRERDGNVCKRCGKTPEENERTLQVHHIDHDKQNNADTNLVTVCNSCNLYLSYHREESLLIFAMS